MKIPEQIVLVIVVMLVGKACGYSEESIRKFSEIYYRFWNYSKC